MLKKIASYVVVLGIGAALGTYFDGKHVIEQTVVSQDRTKTTITEVITERPDGTKVTERLIDKKEKKDQVSNSKESIPTKPNWGVGIKYDLFTPTPVWQAEVNRRIIWDLYVSVYGRTDGTIGAGVTIFF